MEHEATTTKLSEDQLFYVRQRASARKRRWPFSSSTASSAKSCRNCRWNLR
ncbi:MAG: hypothetical protein R3C04_11455 [Hyphomonas sp.]